MLNKFVLYLIRTIKNDNQYSFQSDIKPFDLLIILSNKAMSITRGGFFCIISLRKIKLIFKGKRSVIMHSSKFSFESPLTIGDNVKIDCLGINGIQLGHNVNIPDGSIIR